MISLDCNFLKGMAADMGIAADGLTILMKERMIVYIIVYITEKTG